MHRTFTLAVPTPKTDELTQELSRLDPVLGLAVSRGASLKPPGDVVTLHVLNAGADDVLRAVARCCQGEPYVVASAEITSLIAPDRREQVERDVDEAVWEEMQTGLRHQGRTTANSAALMALGGVIAAVGLVSDPVPQVMAFMAAAVVAPGFEPVAKMALALLLGRWHAVWRGLYSTLVGYAAVMAAAGLTFALLLATGAIDVGAFTGNREVANLAHPTTEAVLVSLAGALAGAVIVSSYRRSVIAGALMALAIIHTAAAIGMGLMCGRADIAAEALERLGIDLGLIVGCCGLVFALKQWWVHRRKPIV